MNVQPIRSAERDRASTGSGVSSNEFTEFLQHASQTETTLSLRAWIDLAEAWKITRTLRECRGNRSAAARALGIGRRTLYAKMEKLGIAPTWTVGEDFEGG